VTSKEWSEKFGSFDGLVDYWLKDCISDLAATEAELVMARTAIADLQEQVASVEKERDAFCERWGNSQMALKGYMDRAEAAEAELKECKEARKRDARQIVVLCEEKQKMEQGEPGLRADAAMLRNCLLALTDGTGDGDGQLIAEGRRAVEDTGYLEGEIK
jgi:predicted  nucleic acid-binding Zn-ribbon protein